MTSPSQERARLREIVLKIFDFQGPDEYPIVDQMVDAFHAHGLAERRAGASDMREAAARAVELPLATDTILDFDTLEVCAKICRALPLPGDDRE